ncbi:MAG: universal stress protein [Candidatus Thiosymbion ectosymbiont of Robbea hypermnestra]|nr:universal stress protein [Candidatus Thiosymbion ectosymbiont of Robbea hypermnestra]
MKRFKNIIYYADGALSPCPALDRAVTLARTNQARLTVLDVLPRAEPVAGLEARLGIDLDTVLREQRQTQLEKLVAGYQEPDTLIYTQVLTGNGFVELIRSVLRGGHDLVIKAARPPEGVSERLFGSTDMHLLRKCPCPVWIDRPAAATPYRSLLAAVDPATEESTGTAHLVMDLATSLAEREATQVQVLHAWRLYGESMLRSGRGRIPEAEVDLLLEQSRTTHRDQLAALLRGYGMGVDDPNVHLVKGEPAPSILQTAEHCAADLIVMGTLGRSGIPGLIIGNTAEDVLQATRASVLAVKPEGFVSPVPDQEQMP